MRIEDLVVQLSTDPFNPELNFKVAQAYEMLNQTASAIAFYLRTAEHGYDTHQDIVYSSLLRMSHCFHDQKDRVNTVSNVLLQAITYLPDRPEAYLLMSHFYERERMFQEAYTWAELGLQKCRGFKRIPLTIDTGYHGEYCFEFQKAVNGWWIGRKEEAIKLFKKLDTLKYMTDDYKTLVKNNLEMINANV